MGFSEVDVGLALLYSAPRSLYGNFYNPTIISQFENLQLSVANTLKLIPVLQKWLEKTESDQNIQRDKTQSNQIIKGKKEGGGCACQLLVLAVHRSFSKRV